MNGCIYRTRSDLCMKFTTDNSISFCVGKKCPEQWLFVPETPEHGVWLNTKYIISITAKGEGA